MGNVIVGYVALMKFNNVAFAAKYETCCNKKHSCQW